MLSFTELKELSPELKALEGARATLIQQRDKSETEATTKGLEAFLAMFTDKGLTPELVGNHRRETSKDGERGVDMILDGNRFTEVKAIIEIPLGTLVFTLSYLRSVDRFTEDWTCIKGTGKIVTKVTSLLTMKGGDVTQHGRIENTAPMHMNLSNAMDTAKRTLEGLTEALLGNAARHPIDEENRLLEGFLAARKFLTDSVNSKEISLRMEHDKLSNEGAEAITATLTAGVTPEDFEEKFLAFPTDIDTNSKGELYKTSARFNNAVVRTFKDGFSHVTTKLITLHPPKRKNSKFQDLFRTFVNTEGDVNYINSLLEREEFEFHVRELARHNATCEILTSLNVNLEVE
tara:strand:+ start:220 stop:1260 length:1041 start_codon:yes stop_codon:yes gene_type:complete